MDYPKGVTEWRGRFIDMALAHAQALRRTGDGISPQDVVQYGIDYSQEAGTYHATRHNKTEQLKKDGELELSGKSQKEKDDYVRKQIAGYERRALRIATEDAMHYHILQDEVPTRHIKRDMLSRPGNASIFNAALNAAGTYTDEGWRHVGEDDAESKRPRSVYERDDVPPLDLFPVPSATYMILDGLYTAIGDAIAKAHALQNLRDGALLDLDDLDASTRIPVNTLDDAVNRGLAWAKKNNTERLGEIAKYIVGRYVPAERPDFKYPRRRKNYYDAVYGRLKRQKK